MSKLALYVTMQAKTSTQVTPEEFRGWPGVDTVLLDMDGTLLDLRFDNFFWLEAVPARFAIERGITIQRANELLTPLFAAKQGTLEWYCTDYWSTELKLDIAALKHELRESVSYLPGAEHFLRTLQAVGLRAVLVTNAHPDALRVKAAKTGILAYLNAAISSHQYGVPKEHPDFWPNLADELRFDCARTLFVDDSLSVLRAARTHGIEHIVAIAHPDSTQERRIVEEFPSVHAVVELLDMKTLPRSSNT